MAGASRAQLAKRGERRTLVTPANEHVLFMYRCEALVGLMRRLRKPDVFPEMLWVHCAVTKVWRTHLAYDMA